VVTREKGKKTKKKKKKKPKKMSGSFSCVKTWEKAITNGSGGRWWRENLMCAKDGGRKTLRGKFLQSEQGDGKTDYRTK